MLALFDTLWILPILVLLFGVTIFIHELGHYLTARWLGLVVEVFSIGFGPSVWEKKVKGIRYKIGCIPFGGYVALPQLDPSGMSHIQGGEGEEERTPLPKVAPWRKMIVSVAGAVGNMLLAVLIAWLVFWIGIPAGPSERSSVVGFVAPESVAYAAGLRIGDEVTFVNDTPVRSWRDVQMEVALNQEVVLVTRGSGAEEPREIDLATGKGFLGEQSLVGVTGCNLCQVLQVAPNMSAAAAGMQAGDLITAFDGVPVWSRGHLSQLVGERQGRTVMVTVERQGEDGPATLELSVTPAFDVETDKARIGIVFNTMAVEHDTVIHPRPMEQIRTHSSAIVRVLRALVTPKQAKAASQAVGGPVAIMVSYWAIVKTSIMLAVWFTGFLNVNLAMLNLLPIPVLDGGHIVFSIWELIFRKPVSPKFVNALVNIFAVLLIGIMIILSVRDLDRFTSLGGRVRKLFADKPVATNGVESVVAPATTEPAPSTNAVPE